MCANLTVFDGLILESNWVGSTLVVNLWNETDDIKTFNIEIFHSGVVEPKLSFTGAIDDRFKIISIIDTAIREGDGKVELCYIRSSYPIVDMIKNALKRKRGSRKLSKAKVDRYQWNGDLKCIGTASMSPEVENYKLDVKFKHKDTLSLMDRTIIEKFLFDKIGNATITVEGKESKLIEELEKHISRLSKPKEIYVDEWKNFLKEFYENSTLVVKCIRWGYTLPSMDIYRKSYQKILKVIKLDTFPPISVELSYNAGRREKIYELLKVIEEIVNPSLPRAMFRIPNGVPALREVCDKIRGLVHFVDTKEYLEASYEDLSEIGHVFGIEEMTDILTRGSIYYS